MNSKYKIAVLFGASHGINDFIAGYLLANLTVTSTNWKLNTSAFLLYSIVAFGGQLPAGLLVDKIKKVKLFSLISLMLMVFAIAISFVNIFAAILLSAFASAFIHVCGGAACYSADSKSATLAGIFTSPGVIGLILGGILGNTAFHFFYLFILPLLFLFFWLMMTVIPIYNFDEETKSERLLDTHDFFMLALFLAIAFRSLVWNVMHMMCFDNTHWLLGLGCSAALGKLIGGFVADKVDWRKFVLVTIVGATIFLNIDKNYFPIFCIGVALLQSAVPITLLLMQNYLQNSPALGAGLSLGVAIVLAGLPTYFHSFRIVQDNKLFILLLSILFFTSNFWIIRKKKTT